MQEPKLFALLPEEYVSTPDGMEPDINGDLILSCPNFADLTMPSCIVRISKDGTIRKWFDVPKNPVTNEARSMGIAFGPDHDLYIVDNQGWTGLPELKFQGRILRVRMDGDRIEKVTTVAYGMEHPNGIRIRDGYMYVTQSTLEKVKTESGNLASCVYRFALDDHDIAITNTLDDPNIFALFETKNPACQYGVDGIVFDRNGDLLIGNFGDGEVYRLKIGPDGSLIENKPWAKNPEELKSTDGMTVDEHGNIYIADFSANAIVRVSPDGEVRRVAQSPDTDGFHGELDEPGEPCIWDGRIIVSCFDLVTDDGKVNTAHEMPATMSWLDIEP